MIVDPATGMPVEEGGLEASSTVGAAGQAAIGDPNSLAYELLGHIPGIATVTAWNMGRGMNTLTTGGYGRGRRLGNFGRQQNNISRFANTFSPLRVGSFSDPLNITGGDINGGAAKYTPFNFMATMGNKATQSMANRALKAAESAQDAISATDTNPGKVLAKLGITERQFAGVAGGTSQVFDGGTLARLGASQRLNYMTPGRKGRLSRRDSRRVAKSIYSLNRIGADVSRIPGASQVLATSRGGGVGTGVRAGGRIIRGLEDGGVRSARMAGGGMLSSMNSITGQRIGGYLQGLGPGYLDRANGGQVYKNSYFKARNAMIDDTTRFLPKHTVGEVLEAGGVKSMRLASKAAMTKGGGRLAANLALKGVTKLGSRAIPVVGWAMLAHDVMGAGIAITKKGLDLAQDANKSFQGQIQKPIFGMGYKDNAINATSRARGLTAIQSSRLNARNALGHEAGMLATHFG